jgi:hypothetical protein
MLLGFSWYLAGATLRQLWDRLGVYVQQSFLPESVSFLFENIPISLQLMGYQLRLLPSSSSLEDYGDSANLC